MKRVVTVVGMVGLLGGCASTETQSPWLINRAEPIPMACAPLSQEQELTLNLAQKTADEGRLHAALANLERLPNSLPQARLQKARLLRSLNRPEAHDLYASLLSTCLKALGEHGLGQLASAAGRNEEALQHLRLAASLDPTSDTIRNDLGVVYMNLGRLDEARFELLTSMELNEAERQPAINLLTLFIYQDNLQQASILADRLQLSPSQYRAAEQRAQAMRRKQGAAAGTAAATPEKVGPVAQTAVKMTPETPPAVAKPAPAAPAVPVGVLAKPAVASAPAKPVTPLAVAKPVAPAAVTAPQVKPVAPAAKPVTAPAQPAVVAAPAKPAAPIAAPVGKPAAPVAAAKPVAPVVAPAAAPAPAAVANARAVPAPQLSNFRPTPVVPPAVAAASAAKGAAPVSAPAQVKQPVVVAAAPSVPAVARPPAAKPAPVIKPEPVAPARPVVAAVNPPAKPVAPAPAPAAAAAPVSAPAKVTPATRPTPAVAVASTQANQPAARPKIELRPGRLIVADDGSIRVEPTDAKGTTVN